MNRNDATADLPSEEDIARDLRQLALVDRIIGLEAEVARLSVRLEKHAGPRFGYNRMLEQVWTSRTWRAGLVALAPARAARSAIHALKRKR